MQEELQSLMSHFSQACKEYGLTISTKKTNVLGPPATAPPSILIDNNKLDAINEFCYLGSTIKDDLSLEKEIKKRIGNAALTFARLRPRVRENHKLTTVTKMEVYKACVMSILLYGSESWTTYTKQERKLNSFHLRCLRRILKVTWKEKLCNSEILARSGIPSIFTALRLLRLCWLGHVRRMEDKRIPKVILYRQLATGTRKTGHPHLHYIDVIKRDLKLVNINTDNWEDIALDRTRWRETVTKKAMDSESTWISAQEEKPTIQKTASSFTTEAKVSLQNRAPQPNEEVCSEMNHSHSTTEGGQ
ncbi:uncharacterized protein LOC129928329 [Biomphalaria glabrata]|uniref:Uncharacterized protein LOC129928329 n=1 Tax=Biomphalaria glabrata TaxID=6526 RepID=A0A9W3BFQ3_BIOGL|nr:uncharacterized protein LOC129928329 [Biomphalaria glabrata]